MRRSERHQKNPGSENTAVAVARFAGGDPCFRLARMEGSVMDKAHRDRINQWGNTKNQSGNDPAPAKGSTELPPPGTPERDIVQVCGWCLMQAGRLNILKIEPCRSWEAIVIYQRGKYDLRMFRNNNRLFVSHGICTACKEREFPKGEVKP
jgi:hypothetical protein